MASSTTPDLTGRKIVITGGNGGIGKESAVALASMGADVIITARNASKGEAALADIRARKTGGTVELASLDLGSFASVRACAADLLARTDRIDVLLNNAGGMLSERQETAEGFELAFGANHLRHFLLPPQLLRALGTLVSVDDHAPPVEHSRLATAKFADRFSDSTHRVIVAAIVFFVRTNLGEWTQFYFHDFS